MLFITATPLWNYFFCTFAYYSLIGRCNIFIMQTYIIKYIYPLRHQSLLIMLLSTFMLQSCLLFAQTPSYPIKNVNGVECIVYKVQPAEGFYRISKNFNTSEAVLREFNPHIIDGLKVGMEIVIPVSKEKEIEKSYIEHIVEKKQTIFRIRKMYDISEDELIAMNPHLKDNPLRTGETLKIPILNKETGKKDAYKTTADKNTNKQQAEQHTPEKNPEKKTTVNNNNPKKPENLNIAFLLPFMLDQKQETSDKRFVEFYAGALIAIKQAKETGINFQIHTFDAERSDLKIMEILQDSNLSTMDLIVGPAFSNQISVVGDFARIHKVKTLIPFSSKIIDIETNPYIFQFNPGQEAELQKLQEIINAEANHTNFVFAEINHVSSSDDGLILYRSLKDYMQRNDIAFQSLTLNSDSIAQIRTALNPLKDNMVFFNTSRINNLSVYLNEFKRLSASVNLMIYEPFSWRNSKLEKPKSFYLSVFKNEYPELPYEAYFKEFSGLFDWTPSSELPRYDLLGYDLMQYFINNVLSSKTLQNDTFPFQEGIQSNLKFEKAARNGGYINRLIYLYE